MAQSYDKIWATIKRDKPILLMQYWILTTKQLKSTFTLSKFELSQFGPTNQKPW